MIEGVADSPNNPDDMVQLPVEGEDQPQILTPVSADDHSRAKNRIRYRNLIVSVLVIAAVAWTYKHYTDPIHANDALDAGERELKSGRYQQAILSFDQALAYRADYPEAYLERGRAYMALAKPKDALVDFEHYTTMRPLDPVGYIDRGRAHLAREDFAAAFEDGMLAVQTGPEVGTAYQLRGIAYRRAGKMAEALADFDKAVALAPEMANYFERGATYQEIGKHDLAIEDFNEVIKFDSMNSQAYHALSKSYRALGNIKQAEADHHEGRRLDGR
jgi:tetratricopeptide (TPR) repeat protein